MKEPVGIELREAHFPGRVPIDAYGNGGFRFADMSHRGSLMCLPSGIYGWDVSLVSDFSKQSFQRLFVESDDVEILTAAPVAIASADICTARKCSCNPFSIGTKFSPEPISRISTSPLSSNKR